MTKRFLIATTLALMTGMVVTAAETDVSISANNTWVMVTVTYNNTPSAPDVPPATAVEITTKGNHFYIFAPGRDDNFIVNVKVEEQTLDWELVSPSKSPATFTLTAKNNTKGYKVKNGKEGNKQGTIYFYNYYIKSNIDDGAKKIAVKAGTEVTYTAKKNAEEQRSTWTVNGKTKNNAAVIIFNRRWWDVGAWFLTSMGTPDPGVYNIKARDKNEAKLEDFGEMTVYKFDFTISKSDLTLKHNCKTTLIVTAEPASKISNPTVQITRSGVIDGVPVTPEWLDLLDGRGTIPWTGRVAGNFKLRAKAMIDGKEHLTEERDLTVKFPTFDQITSDPTVNTAMASEWQATLDDYKTLLQSINGVLVNDWVRRERGFWVLLNTGGDGTYSCANYTQGGFAHPLYPSLSIDLGTRPPANLSAVSPAAQGAMYTVASFHTHPPEHPDSQGRPSGPSDYGNGKGDKPQDERDNVAGIVYDYTANPVPRGHPKNSLAKAYNSRNQRSIDRE
jgi:hypothetical protein